MKNRSWGSFILTVMKHNVVWKQRKEPMNMYRSVLKPNYFLSCFCTIGDAASPICEHINGLFICVWYNLATYLL